MLKAKAKTRDVHRSGKGQEVNVARANPVLSKETTKFDVTCVFLFLLLFLPVM